MRKLWFVAALVLLSGVLGATLLREPVAWAAQAVNATIVGPLDDAGNVRVRQQGTVTVAGSVEVTNDPPAAVVLRDPTSADHVTPATPRLYSFDTSSLAAVRVGFQSFSGSENCRVQVFASGFPVREWNLTGQFQAVGDVFEVPGTRLNVRVESTNVCFAYLGAWGVPIA